MNPVEWEFGLTFDFCEWIIRLPKLENGAFAYSLPVDIFFLPPALKGPEYFCELAASKEHHPRN